MDQTVRKNLAERFQTKVKCIFNDNLCFAFIFGSVAKGREERSSDIDMFICTVNELSMQQKTDFFNFYMNMHHEYGLNPDEEYPGEIVNLEFLMKNIDFVQTWVPHKEIKTYREFESVFWTAVLDEKKMAVTGDLAVLRNLEAHCNSMVKKWKRAVATGNVKYDIDELSLLDVLTREGYQFLVQHRPEVEDFLK